MKSVNRIIKLAERFAHKIAQQSADAGAIQDILTAAGLWDKSAEVAPMLNAAGIPDDTAVQTFIMVDNKLNCKYRVALLPPRPAASNKLAALLTAKYAAAHRKALIDAKTAVTDTLEVGWVKF